MINSLVPNFSHLKEILFKARGFSQDVDPLINALNERVGQTGRHRFFSKDKDARGKWVIPGFSGFLISERYRVECIVIGEKGKPSQFKKIFHAVHVIFSENQVKVFPILFKKIVFSTKEDAARFLQTQRFHIQIAIRMEERGQLAHRPDLLRIAEKKDQKIKIEIKEPRCEFDLLEWQEDLRVFLRGMVRIAKYLIEIREQGYVHSDVKRGNILIHQNTFYLSDFKLCTKVGSKRVPKNYFAWDSTAEKLGLITPFCDVYGWAIAMGSSLWDVHFYNLAMDKNRLHSDALEKEIWKSLAEQDLIPNEIILPRYSHHLANGDVKEWGDVAIHFLFYRFLKKILASDLALLKYYQENSDQKNSPSPITMEDCLLFIHNFLGE